MRRTLWIPLAALFVMIAALLLMPPERHLGRLLALIYVHGTLVRTGIVLFVMGAIAGAIALIKDSPDAWAWTYALQATSLGAWLSGFIISFYPSYVTWGTLVAWSEPRTQMVVKVIAIATMVFLVARWLGDRRIVAGASVVIGLIVPLLVWRTGVIRHPIDPVGTSPSVALRTAYTVALFCMIVIGVWVTAQVARHYRTHQHVHGTL